MAVDKKLILNQIYSTSIQLFMDKGFDNISVNEICRNVGITKPTFYRYVNSKDDILANYYFNIPEFYPDIEPDENGEVDYIQVLTACLRHSFSHYLSLGIDMLSAHIVSQTHGMSLLSQANPEWASQLMEYVKKGQESGQILSDISAEELLLQLQAGLLGYAYMICSENRDDYELSDLQDMLEVICRGKSAGVYSI